MVAFSGQQWPKLDGVLVVSEENEKKKEGDGSYGVFLVEEFDRRRKARSKGKRKGKGGRCIWLLFLAKKMGEGDGARRTFSAFMRGECCSVARRKRRVSGDDSGFPRRRKGVLEFTAMVRRERCGSLLLRGKEEKDRVSHLVEE
ncbi:hypothetical protein HAX54_049460 [Datura stramonium]|uniref:Uncharacterized protein n=1 Tax=Datura stramonium TaxID=4076 RepID=A0ABS8WKG6_DATST|nr:hypothetical protein [Datura stramonium]